MASKKDSETGRVPSVPLDEYGVWIHKAVVPEHEAFTDLPMAEELEEAAPGAIQAVDEETIPFEDDVMTPGSGGLPEEEFYTEREARLMSDMENNNDKLADDSDAVEISLDDSDELGLSDSDDLSDLSDLLMSIDEDTSEEETVFLEDEDLSLDLDSASDDLLLDAETNESPLDEEMDEDIVIPGLDDLNLDESLDIDSVGLDDIDGLAAPDETNLFTSESPALTSNDEVEFEVPALDDEDENLPDIKMNSAEEDDLLDLASGLNDEDGLLPPLADEPSMPAVNEEAILDEALSDDQLLAETPEEELVLEDETAEDLVSANSVIDDSLPDFEEDADETDFDTGFLDNAPETAPVPDMSMDIFDEPPLTLQSEQEPDADNLVPTEELTEPMTPEDEAVITVGQFDDVAAAEETFSKKEIQDDSALDEQETVAVSPGGATILRSIEDELHAIRSELIDLRSELKRLRSKEVVSSKDDEVETPPAGESVLPLDMTDDGIMPDMDIQTDNEDALAQDDLESGTEKAGGFFDDDDDDETVALTGDELDNILNSADFIEEKGEPSSLDESEITEQPEDKDFPSLETEAFEEAGIIDEFSPIEEIQLEEFSAPDVDSVSSTENQEIPGTNDAEVVAMANLDIDKELEGIENLNDEDDDFELFTGNDFSDLTIDIPEEVKQESVSPESELDIETEVPSILSEEETGIDNDDELTGIPEPEIGSDSFEEPVFNETEENEIDTSLLEQNEDELSYSLRNEIKAVLSYMDKLLESLPEEKIEEFARSEHFDVYKKLFEELGI